MKEQQVQQFSDPDQVRINLKKHFPSSFKLFYSTRKNKKYMVYDEPNDKYIHFGEMGYEDYTKHKDEERRQAFKQRNKKWSKQKQLTPGWLAYNLLW